MTKGEKKKRLSPEEVKQRRIKFLFKRKIRSVFVGAGFTYIATNDHEMYVGLRRIEVDSLFIYENIWLLCEDTIKTSSIREHIRTKNESFREIKKNMEDYRKKLSELFPEKKDLLTRYDLGRIKVYGLYISREEVDVSDDDERMFENLVFVQPKMLNYFNWIVQSIKLSARYEVFRFLGIKNSDIGRVCSGTESTQITAPIVYPKEFTGIKSKVRIVSFMMSADDLLNMCYVLRKDNWDESIWLYQRLIDKNKIKSIRTFIETKGEAFYNNIIVALPDNISFVNGSNNYCSIKDIGTLDGTHKLVLPREINSICIIDGQHRIYAHYESGIPSKQEETIASLRKQLHLLVTGLVFPEEMATEDRIRFQSQLFLDINSTAKPVPPNVILHIKRITNPIADESLAQFVVERLNKEGVFKNMFQLSSLDNAKIKTASIIRFALRYLVTIKPSENKKSLFEFWSGNHDDLKNMRGDAISNYVDFCVNMLNIYFGAIKKNLRDSWKSEDSKILSVTAINGFIIAFTRQLSINNIRDFEYYDGIFSNWEFDFSKEGFIYASSQYRKFSTRILLEAFKVPEAIVDNL